MPDPDDYIRFNKTTKSSATPAGAVDLHYSQELEGLALRDSDGNLGLVGPETTESVLALLPTFHPENYGAPADGVTDATQAFQDMIDAMPDGAMAVIPRMTYKIAGTIEVTKQIKLVGQGSGYVDISGFPGPQVYIPGASTFKSSSLTLDMFEVTSGGLVCEDIAFLNTNYTGTRPSAGAAFRVHDASGMQFSRCLFNGFYDALKITGGHLWRIIGCDFINHKHAGIDYSATDIPDGGDMFVTGCNFVIFEIGAGTATASVICRSSGGMRFIGNKINGTGSDSHGVGFLVDLAASAVTGVFIFSGNSVEGCINHGLKMSGASGSAYYYPQISTNEFAGTSTGIEIGANIHKAHINDNVFSSIGYASIVFASGATYCVAAYNTHLSSPRAVWLKAGSVGCKATVQNFVCQPGHTTNEVIRDETANDTVVGNDAVVEYDYIQRLSANTPLAVGDVIVFQFTTGGGAGTFEVELQGFEQTQGAFLHRIARTYHRSPFDGTMANTTIGTDISIGDAVDSTYLTLDVATAGYVIIKVTKTGSSVSTGTVRMKINGKPSMFILGPA